MENAKILSFHNQCVMEQLLDDFEKEILKFRLGYEYLSQHGFTSSLDSLFLECVSFLEQHVHSFSLFLDCVSKGCDMNPEPDGGGSSPAAPGDQQKGRGEAPALYLTTYHKSLTF